MAITFINDKKFVLGGGTTGTSNMTGATFLAAVTVSNGQGGLGNPPVQPSDSLSNTYTLVISGVDIGFGGRLGLWIVENATVDAAMTFTIATGQNAAGAVIGYSGVKSSGSVDQAAGTGGLSNPMQAGSITPTQNDELVISIAGGIPTSYSIDGGFTIQEQNAFSGGSYFGFGIADLIQTTAAAANPSWTDAGGSGGGAINYSFFAATGGGGGNPWYAYAQFRR